MDLFMHSGIEYGHIMMLGFLTIVFGGLVLLFVIAGIRRWDEKRITAIRTEVELESYRDGHKNGYALGEQSGRKDGIAIGDGIGFRRGFDYGCQYTHEQVRQVGPHQAYINYGLEQIQYHVNKS